MIVSRIIISNEINSKEHREYLEGLTEALKKDGGREFPIDITYHIKCTAGWSSNPPESWVVQPRYNVRDPSQRSLVRPRGVKVFVAGDGNIGGNLLIRSFQLFGMPRALPGDYKGFGYVHNIDQRYFEEGSKARQFMKEQGDEWFFRELPKVLDTAQME